MKLERTETGELTADSQKLLAVTWASICMLTNKGTKKEQVKERKILCKKLGIDYDRCGYVEVDTDSIMREFGEAKEKEGKDASYYRK